MIVLVGMGCFTPTSSSSELGGENCHPLVCFHVFFFLPVFFGFKAHILLVPCLPVVSKSKCCIFIIKYLCPAPLFVLQLNVVDKPLLRSTSTHIRDNVKILSSSLCVSILMYQLMVLLMPRRFCWSHRCNGRFCRGTQTSILDTTIVFA